MAKPKRKTSTFKKNCCPRIKLVCKKVGGETLKENYWELKSPLSKPHQKTASVHVPGRVKCAIVLGKKAVTPFKNPKSDFNKSIARMEKVLKARGCADTSLDDSKGPGNFDMPSRPQVPSGTPDAVVAKLEKRLKKFDR